jgi:hypothetical protein
MAFLKNAKIAMPAKVAAKRLCAPVPSRKGTFIPQCANYFDRRVFAFFANGLFTSPNSRRNLTA